MNNKDLINYSQSRIICRFMALVFMANGVYVLKHVKLETIELPNMKQRVVMGF